MVVLRPYPGGRRRRHVRVAAVEDRGDVMQPERLKLGGREKGMVLVVAMDHDGLQVNYGVYSTTMRRRCYLSLSKPDRGLT
jgi:hypothetical protein